MTWVTPRTWTTGETVTAMQLNVHVRDDLNYLYNPPACRAIHDGNQSSATPLQVVDFNRTTFDNDRMRDLSDVDVRPYQATQFIVLRTAGKYLITADIAFSVAASTGLRVVYIYGLLAGTDSAIGAAYQNNPGTVAPSKVSVQTVYEFAAGEGIIILGLISPVSQVDMIATVAAPAISAHWLGG